MAVFLNSFTPLATNKTGRASANKYNLPLFIDGSCRREPDFENTNPAITQLCRPTKLVTRLSKKDLVIYITKLGRYGTKEYGWRLISILEIIDILPNHSSASNYYINNGIPISQNIICDNTAPFPLDKTHSINENTKKYTDSNEVIQKWNAGYKYRARKYPEVAITKVWNDVLYLNNPPIINHQIMNDIFGRIPGTQNPPQITNDEWNKFRKEMNI